MRIFIFLFVFPLLISCGYEGDGKIVKVEGPWPFSDEFLELPKFSFQTEEVQKFSLRGLDFPEYSYVILRLLSDSSLPFHQLNTNVELRIFGETDVTHFYRNSPLNSHYLRMVQTQKTEWPKENEWNARYSYEEIGISLQAVPFSTNSEPISVHDIKYSHRLPMSDDLRVEIIIGNVPKNFEGTEAQLVIASYWK